MSNSINGLKVVSEAPKFLALIPVTDRLLDAPVDAVIAEYSPVKSGKAAIWIHNATDIGGGKTPNGTWQGAMSGGFLIVNNVKEADGIAANAMLDGGYDIDDIDAVSAFLLSKGYDDQYATNDGYANGNVSKDTAPRVLPVSVTYDTTQKAHKADRAKIVSGLVMKDGSKQDTLFRKDGLTYILHADGTEPKRIEDHIVVVTHRKVDGTAIVIDEIPVID